MEEKPESEEQHEKEDGENKANNDEDILKEKNTLLLRLNTA